MSATKHETILGNAGIILADRVIERGWVAIADGRIAEFGEGDAPAGSVDAAGDLIMPGLIELHTDHLEAHRSGSGARTVPRKSTAGQAYSPRRSQRRARKICCAPITSCICVAKSRCRAWSRKPRS
jgi:alpha-D-ribose 1-methylphosphonate 5-triphosphate diphosphatase PhnM